VYEVNKRVTLIFIAVLDFIIFECSFPHFDVSKQLVNYQKKGKHKLRNVMIQWRIFNLPNNGRKAFGTGIQIAQNNVIPSKKKF